VLHAARHGDNRVRMAVHAGNQRRHNTVFRLDRHAELAGGRAGFPHDKARGNPRQPPRQNGDQIRLAQRAEQRVGALAAQIAGKRQNGAHGTVGLQVHQAHLWAEFLAQFALRLHQRNLHRVPQRGEAVRQRRQHALRPAHFQTHGEQRNPHGDTRTATTRNEFAQRMLRGVSDISTAFAARTSGLPRAPPK
jgi:hypothetical protein